MQHLQLTLRPTPWGWALAHSRKRAQVMVIAAVAIGPLLIFAALVFNVGLFLAERRALQNAADAAAIAAVWQLAAEHANWGFRDEPVYSAAADLGRQNGLDIGSSHQLTGSYVDAAGTVLRPLGGGGPFPAAAVGIRVTLTGPFVSLLGAFLDTSGVEARADAEARLARAAFPTVHANPVPLAVPLAAFEAAQSFDLYDQSVALSAYGVSGYQPFLDLTYVGNSGPGYVPAVDYGGVGANLQYWSDGGDDAGVLTIGSQIAISKGSYGTDVRDGLIDNLRRQGLTSPGGAAYALLTLPLWSTYIPSSGPGIPDMIVVAGFATFRLPSADIGASSLPGYFVPTATPSNRQPISGVLWGPSNVLLHQ